MRRRRGHRPAALLATLLVSLSLCATAAAPDELLTLRADEAAGRLAEDSSSSSSSFDNDGEARGPGATTSRVVRDDDDALSPSPRPPRTTPPADPRRSACARDGDGDAADASAGAGDHRLASLRVSRGLLRPAFRPDVTSYELTLRAGDTDDADADADVDGVTFVKIFALPCDAAADVVVAGVRVPSNVAFAHGAEGEVRTSIAADAATDAADEMRRMPSIPLALGENALAITTHADVNASAAGRGEPDATYAVRVRVSEDAGGVARAASRAAGWTLAPTAPDPLVFADEAANGERAVALGPLTAVSDAAIGKTVYFSAPLRESTTDRRASGERAAGGGGGGGVREDDEWVVEVVGVPPRGVGSVYLTRSAEDAVGERGARVAAPRLGTRVASPLSFVVDESIRLDGRNRGGRSRGGVKMAFVAGANFTSDGAHVLYRACRRAWVTNSTTTRAVSCGNAPPSRVEFRRARGDDWDGGSGGYGPSPPPATSTTARRRAGGGVSAVVTLPRLSSRAPPLDDLDDDGALLRANDLPRRELEIASLPAKGSLVLCGDSDDADAVVALRYPRSIPGDADGTPATLVYVPYGREGGSGEWAREACEDAKRVVAAKGGGGGGGGGGMARLGPRARRIASRVRALLSFTASLGGGGAGGDGGRRSLLESSSSSPNVAIDGGDDDDVVAAAPAGETADATDGFSYRHVVNGVPSPASPVTIALPRSSVGADGADDADAAENAPTPPPRASLAPRRRRLLERVEPISTAALALDIPAVLALDPASTSATPTCAEASVAASDVSDAWTCAASDASDKRAGYPGPTTCRKPEYEVRVEVVGDSIPDACFGAGGFGYGPERVWVGATFVDGGSCPASGSGHDENGVHRTSWRSVAGGAFRREGPTQNGGASGDDSGGPLRATLRGLSSCGDDEALTVWAWSSCVEPAGHRILLNVTVSRSPPRPEPERYHDGRGPRPIRPATHPRKRLADCLVVPPVSGLICPEDLSLLPRPRATCPAPGASGEELDAVLTLAASQPRDPSGHSVALAPDARPGAVVVPRNLTVFFDLLGPPPHPKAATLYQHDANGRRGARLPSSLDFTGAPIRVADADGRLLVSPTPRLDIPGAHARSLPGTPAASMRYLACVAEDGTCASQSGSAEVDVTARPLISAENAFILTEKGKKSDGFRVYASDEDSNGVMTVVTSLPEVLETLGTLSYCPEPMPAPSSECATAINLLLRPCSGGESCIILCSGAAQCVECLDDTYFRCPGQQTPTVNPLIYWTAGTCAECAGKPVGALEFKAHDGAQFSSPMTEPGHKVELHVNTPPQSISGGIFQETIARTPEDCGAECAADCAEVCRRSCIEYLSSASKNAEMSLDWCEIHDASGECDNVACVAECDELRCDSHAFALYSLSGSDVDGDPLSFRVSSIPKQLVVNPDDQSVTSEDVGKVYQTALAPGESSFRRIYGPDDLVLSRSGVIKFIPQRGSQGRPVGGLTGLQEIKFRVNDGYADASSTGSVSFAVNSPPTTENTSTPLHEGANITLSLGAVDAADCPAGYCGKLPDGSYSGAMKARVVRVAPLGVVPGLYHDVPIPDADGGGAMRTELRCDGVNGTCEPPILLTGVDVFYDPPEPTRPVDDLNPPGLESSGGVLSVYFVADDGELLSSTVGVANITYVPKPRAADVVVSYPSKKPKSIGVRVPSLGEYYDGQPTQSTRVTLAPLPSAFASCGDQTVSEDDRIHTKLVTLPPADVGYLSVLREPSNGWFNPDGTPRDPPETVAKYTTTPGFYQVNAGSLAEGAVDNPMRQVLFTPLSALPDDGVAYNTSFTFRVCVTKANEDGSRVCDAYGETQTATIVVEPHNLPPVATPTTAPSMLQGVDSERGVVFSLHGTDPEGGDVSPSITLPPGFSVSCGDASSACGVLYQYDALGTFKRGDAFPSSCSSSSPCPVTDPEHRVLFVPDENGRDPYGPNAAAYAAIEFVVVDDVGLTSQPERVEMRVNAAPTITPATTRRVFVFENSAGPLPLSLLGSDSDGDVLTFEILSAPNPTGGDDDGAFYDVNPADGSRGRRLDLNILPQALTPGNNRVWFEPKLPGNVTGCCPARECVTLAGVNLPSTCNSCDSCVEVGTSCECANVCCPHRFFYGELTYRVSDSNNLFARNVGRVHIHVKPSNDAPVVGEDFTVVAFEGEPIELELKGADEDETCVTTQIAGVWRVTCEPQLVSAVIVDAPKVTDTEGALTDAFGAANTISAIAPTTGNYVGPPGFPSSWFGAGSKAPNEMTATEAMALDRAVLLSNTLKVTYTPPPIAAGFPFFTLRYGLKDASGAYSADTARVQIVVRHKLDDVLSRFVRLPNWYFRPIDAPLKDSVDWWANGAAGINPATLDPETTASHWLTPKKRDQMGSFGVVFGRNEAGQLGLGHAAIQRLPVLDDAEETMKLELASIAAGEYSAVGISRAPETLGQAYAWGDGANGRLGLGHAYPRARPTKIEGVDDVASVAASAGHACAVTKRGEAYCWGADADGQLGRPRRRGSLRGPAAAATDAAAAAAADPLRPHRVVGGGFDRVDVVGVAVGEFHTVALSSEGVMWSWGSNANGQLGRLECAERSHHPKSQPRTTTIETPDGNETRTIFGGNEKLNGTGCEAYGAPAVGRQETPGPVELALMWRPYGRSADSRDYRVRDSDLEPVRFSQIAAAGSFTVAVSADPLPGTPAAIALEKARKEAAFRPPGNLINVDVDADEDALGAAKRVETAAVAPGRVYTFGHGPVGQLGHGVGRQPGREGLDDHRVMVPTPIAALEGVDVVQVSASRHHVAAVTRDGRVWTWGGNSHGQLGHGDRITRFVPKRVDALKHVNITAVAAGLHHTVAICDLGEVYAWGSNEFGELGLDPQSAFELEENNANEPYLTLRGWRQIPNVTNLLNSGETGRRRARRLLRMDASDDPEGEYDLIFERLRDDEDASGNVGHAHSLFKSLLSGVQPLTPPPWVLNGSEFDLAAFGWGWVVGQSAESAGRPDYVTVPQLVRGATQVGEIAAGGGFTRATRRACRPGSRLDKVTGDCVVCATGAFAEDLSATACSPCAPGRAAPVEGASRCDACAPGSYASLPGTETCALCPGGTFLGFGGASSAEQCVACSPGTFSALPGASACAPCGPGTYQESSASTACVECPASTSLAYSRSRSAADCLACPSGSFGDAPGKSSCEPCPAGHFAATPGSSVCAPCAVGSFSAGEGNVKCDACPAGTYGAAAAATSAAACPPCAPGTYSNALGAASCAPCAPGTYASNPGSTECVGCPAGTFGYAPGATSAAQCDACPKGEYNPTSGRARIEFYNALIEATEYVKCVDCAQGTYADVLGSTVCKQCPPGTHLNYTGARSVSECYACAPGSFAPVGGLDACLPCPPGTYVETFGGSACVGCPPGSFNAFFGSNSVDACEPCPPGTFIDAAGGGSCTLCPEGHYQPLSGQSSCLKCAAGFYLPEKNATSADQCLPCDVGTFAAAPGTAECSPCPAGSFASSPRSSSCDPCAAGTVYGLTGGNSSSQCVACGPGTVAPNPGMSECAECPLGRYNTFFGATSCTPCSAGLFLPFTGSQDPLDCQPCGTDPYGTYSPTPGAGACERCPRGTYADADGLRACVPVPRGFFLPQPGSNSSADAIPCPVGTFANEPGAELCADCPTGSYADQVGTIACSPCDAGFFLPTEKATSGDQCRKCPIGTRSAAGAGQCNVCPPGQYGDEEALPECLSCPPGTYQALAGASSADQCLECAIGFHNTQPGKAQCLPCIPGTYGNLTGMAECWKCLPGTFIDLEGSIFPSDCAPCALGTFADQHGSAVCDPCPPGSYNDEEGRDSCKLCPARTYGPRTGATGIELCEYCPRWHFNTTPGTFQVQDCVYEHSGARSFRGGGWTFAVVVALVAALGLI